MMIHHSIKIERPPEVVFAFLTDPASGPKISKDIRAITPIGDKPLGVGSQFHEEIKEGGKYTTYLGTVIAYDPPKRYAFKLEGWGCGKMPSPDRPSKYTINLNWVLSPEGKGTKVDVACGCDMSKAGFFMRILSAIIGGIMAKAMRGMMRKQMEAAKAAIEAS